MLPDGRRLGAHLPVAAGMVKAADRAHAIGAATLQIFSDNPTAWRRRSTPPRGLDTFLERIVAHDIGPLAIHASYLVNLAGSDETSYERSVTLLTHELADAPSFGARFVNVHIGSHLGEGVETGIRRLAVGVERVLEAVTAGSTRDDPSQPAMLVLENSSGGGGGLGTSVEELAGIADALGAHGIGRHAVGFCLDTAHAWGAGVDVGDPRAIDRALAGFDRRIGLDRLVMVHLNDSRSELGSRSDRHEHLGGGRIDTRGLRHILRHRDLAHAAYYLETPGMDEGYDAVNLGRARDLAAGRELAPLPPAAFELRGNAAARTAPP